MNAKSIIISSGALLLAGMAFWAGALLGQHRQAAKDQRDVVEWLVPVSVHDYRLLESGDTEQAKRKIAQRIWSFLDQRDREFPHGTWSASFRKAEPEASRIINVVSNPDWKHLIGDLDPDTRRYMEAMFHDAYPGLFATNATGGATNLQGGANGRQPFSSGTNRTSAAAASRSSP